jgi:type II secretory pathway pseudopilin PulG
MREVERELLLTLSSRSILFALDTRNTEAGGGARYAEASSEGGFSIVEVLVATTIVTVAVAALAQVIVLSTRANGGARATTYASILAQQKMEQLRGLTWGFDVLGMPTSDTTTDLTTRPETAAGGKGLRPSPGNSLGSNTEGYCDFVDKFGKPLGGGTTPPARTAYVRRWSIELLPADPTNTLVLQEAS